mmetsp:Transcript_124346/g.264952  ORF Transcript_124346/g.264952 Transcript_124346/m.264952 type:complete len:228 (+) Transcript_124346:839-1522(+)
MLVVRFLNGPNRVQHGRWGMAFPLHAPGTNPDTTANAASPPSLANGITTWPLRSRTARATTEQVPPMGGESPGERLRRRHSNCPWRRRRAFRGLWWWLSEQKGCSPGAALQGSGPRSAHPLHAFQRCLQPLSQHAVLALEPPARLRAQFELGLHARRLIGLPLAKPFHRRQATEPYVLELGCCAGVQALADGVGNLLHQCAHLSRRPVRRRLWAPLGWRSQPPGRLW